MASRRNFIKNASLIGALPLLPNPDFFNKSNEVIRTAHIGVGGMGKADLNDIASHKKVKVVALCDVDSKHYKLLLKNFPMPKLSRTIEKCLMNFQKILML